MDLELSSGGLSGGEDTQFKGVGLLISCWRAEVGLLVLTFCTCPSPSSSPLISPFPTPSTLPLSFSNATGRPRTNCVCVCVGLWLHNEEDCWRLSQFDGTQSYGFCNTAQYRSLHSVFHSCLKFSNIFMDALWMTENIYVLLNWAITVTESCYVIILFQSCQNFLLYFYFTFYLLRLQNRFSQ